MLSFWNPAPMGIAAGETDKKSDTSKEKGESSTSSESKPSADQKANPHFTRRANGSLIFLK